MPMCFCFRGVMWTFVLTLGLLCWGSEADVRCKNNADASVDW